MLVCERLAFSIEKTWFDRPEHFLHTYWDTGKVDPSWISPVSGMTPFHLALSLKQICLAWKIAQVCPMSVFWTSDDRDTTPLMTMCGINEEFLAFKTPFYEPLFKILWSSYSFNQKNLKNADGHSYHDFAVKAHNQKLIQKYF
jgi:hypothetical protein